MLTDYDEGIFKNKIQDGHFLGQELSKSVKYFQTFLFKQTLSIVFIFKK